MKNISLFVTLGLISLMGAFTAVNAGEMDSPDMTGDTVELQDASSNELQDPSSTPEDSELEGVNEKVGLEDDPITQPDGSVYIPAEGESATDPGATDPVDTAPAAE